MAHSAPLLPTFPVWCRAKFSFTAESRNDLGFVEGDLIQAVNAGDGSWWVGRLGRNAREMGHFPSNFVEVLDQGFRPVNRVSSRSPSPIPPPQEIKSKTFRKPFQAYSAQNPSASKGAELQDQECLSIARSPLPQRGPNHFSISQVSSPDVHDYGSKVLSLTRAMGHSSVSPSPVSPPYHGSRTPSPAPSFNYQPFAGGPSPQPRNEVVSSPPPPPPPHRIAYTPQGFTNSYSRDDDSYKSSRSSVTLSSLARRDWSDTFSSSKRNG